MTNENPLALSFQLTRTSTSFFTSQQHHLPSYSLHVLPVSSLVKFPSPAVCMMETEFDGDYQGIYSLKLSYNLSLLINFKMPWS